MKRFKVLKLFAFVMLGLGLVLGAEIGQAVAETWLVPQENQMHALVNQTRATRGVGSLPNNDALRWMARRQASDMAAQGYIFHNTSLGEEADQASLPWVALGENVGKGGSVESIQSAFLVSPGHLRNIVSPDFNALGVGGTADPQSILYFTQVFAGLQAPAAPPPPPADLPPPTDPPPPAAPAPEPGGTTGGETDVQGSRTIPPTVAPTSDGDAEGTDATPTVDPTATSDQDTERTSRDTDAERPKRPSILELLLAMLGRFFGKLAFWG